ncbi:MAG: Wzz/FepE/Etk N-terminal domain-containing protein, partial [Candidatus Deferrimicrobiaceae bacterium]
MQVKEEPYVLVPPEDQYNPHPDTNVRDYIDVLLRRRKTFLAAFLAVLLGAIAYTYTMKPVYEASATLHVRGGSPNSGRVNVFSFDGGSSVEAELEILKSRTNAEEVVRRLQLDWQVTKKSPGLEFKILEFTSTAEDPTY